MINTATNGAPRFLGQTPTDSDQFCWSRGYATYLTVNGKTPEEWAKEPLNLIELLPSFRRIDTKWEDVSPEMMKTTHVMIHRLKIFLERFKKEVKKVYEEMH